MEAVMKAVFSESFYPVYTLDPAATAGRMESVFNAFPAGTEIIEALPADERQITRAHTMSHIAWVRSNGLYDIAALAAGGAVQAARIGLTEPAFAAIRPPGHHASSDSAWGFCYFNNMAVALLALKDEDLIDTALVLDFDLHYGDGNVNILGDRSWVHISNPDAGSRQPYLEEVEKYLTDYPVSIIGISAGFDNHREDWGGLMVTEDYYTMGTRVREAAADNGGGCFAILEGGYNHDVLGQNVAALMEGMSVAA